MKYRSTREAQARTSLSEAIALGLAPDGGLFVPEELPTIHLEDWSFDTWPKFAERLLQPYFEGDPLLQNLRSACETTFQFPIPLRQLTPNLQVLELFHGPTCAFKDIGAQFLAALLPSIAKRVSNRPQVVMVATSGDTGGAVAAAIARQPSLRGVIFYPKGRISPRQEQQLTCWPKNILALAVNGSFDNCQDMVKQAFREPAWNERYNLISANSISLGRLLPQMVYFAGTSLQNYRKTKKRSQFVIPTGNLGNAMAAIWAREMGFPIQSITLALNANAPLETYFKTGHWQPLPSVATLANAMDVGKASNFERLQDLFSRTPEVKNNIFTSVASDQEIRDSIRRVDEQFGYTICPHTATAEVASRKLKIENATLVATAHPAKFHEIVMGETGREVEVPQPLQDLLHLSQHKVEIEANLESAIQVLNEQWL
jgi:threonine synthase